MSLATRCPACGTIFRVVQDQLKVSEGWVRCGQCHEVFHGIEALFDLDSDPAVAARRAAARGPLAPPLTRAFADQRASAPIPMPTPAAPTAPPTTPVAIPARAPAPPAPVTAPAPIASGPAPQSVPATPSAFGGSNHPPVTTGLRPGYTGFTPATRPLPPPPAPPAPLPAPAPPEAMPPPASGSTQFAPVATRGTIAPRFAARLAEEAAARAQAAAPTTRPGTPASPAPPPFGSALTQHAAPSVQPPMAPPPAPTIAPPPAIVPSESAPAQATSPAFAPVSVPAPPPAPAPIFAVPDEYIPPSIAANRASVFAPPPAPVVAPIRVTAPEPASEPQRAEAPRDTPPVDATPSAADLATSFAAPPSEETSTAAQTAPRGDLELEAASEADNAPTPRDVTEAAEAEAAAELRAGPPTLASMLPEDAGDWPPRRTKKRAASPAAPASEVALVDRSKDPRFLREAKSGARWRRPWVRAVLSATLLVLVVAAVGQMAWPQRDLLASRWPATLPAWNWLCEQAGCRIEAPRAIASLALDGSSLTRTDTEHVLLFSADLHNRADHEVRMPSFDLTFMDLNGEIVARKVLSPEQIGIRQAALPAEGELHVHARLQVGSLPASGFQADLFYP